MDIKKGQTMNVIYLNKLTSKLDSKGYGIRETFVQTVTVKRVAHYKKTNTTRVAVSTVSSRPYGYTIVNPKLDSDGNIVINCK